MHRLIKSTVIFNAMNSYIFKHDNCTKEVVHVFSSIYVHLSEFNLVKRSKNAKCIVPLSCCQEMSIQ